MFISGSVKWPEETFVNLSSRFESDPVTLNVELPFRCPVPLESEMQTKIFFRKWLKAAVIDWTSWGWQWAWSHPYLCLTLGLKLSVGWMCSCCARGVPHGWYNLKHSLQKLARQSAQPLVASRVWGGLQNWHITATLPRLTVCLYLAETEMIQCETIYQLQCVWCFLEVAVGVGQVIITFWLSAPSHQFTETWSKYPHDKKEEIGSVLST